MTKVDDVAAAILASTGEVTTWKLQKLVYYAQSWFLAKNGRALFDDDFEAWREGPVVRHLYNQHRGRNRVKHWPQGNTDRLHGDELSLLTWVVKKYGSLSAETLSEMTHAEVPWFVARGDLPPSAPSTNKLDRKIMQTFYSRQEASPDIAVSQAIANASLEGVELGSDWEQELRRLAEGEVSAEELIQVELDRVRRGRA